MNEIIPGSLAQVSKNTGKSLAESWINVEAVILVDISGSMDIQDARGGKSRYSVAGEELARLQASLPGKLAIVAWSDDAQFMPSGALPRTCGTTDLAGALRYSKKYDLPEMRFVVISDGEPDSESDALDEAQKYKNRIDTVYVGPEGGSGQKFLAKLAKLKNGQSMIKPHLAELAVSIIGLLEAR